MLALDDPPPRSTVFLARVEDRILPHSGQRAMRALMRSARNLNQELSRYQERTETSGDADDRRPALLA